MQKGLLFQHVDKNTEAQMDFASKVIQRSREVRWDLSTVQCQGVKAYPLGHCSFRSQKNRAPTASGGENGTVRSVVLCGREQTWGRGVERKESLQSCVCDMLVHI